MSITTSIRRRRTGLFAIGAVAALAAGCGAVGPTAVDTAAGGGDGRSDVHVAVGAHGNQDRDRDEQDQNGDDSTPRVTTPKIWAGTVSTERFAPGDATAYLAMVHLHGDAAVDSMSADRIEGTEFLAGLDARCEGEAVLGGSASSCTFVDADSTDGTMSAQVRLVSTGFGNTALLFGAGGEGGADLAAAPDAALGLQSIGGLDIAAVTPEDLEDAALSGVMMGRSMDGELPTDLDIGCEVADGGEHGLCQVTGTPDGGGDGTWIATAQHAYHGDRDAYLFTRLPQS
ncbi:hypothetical protein [Brachybacterium sp.]|uniref:hypothetical protein n=1 Tax=Brachybacterium sp. TaxID=1891286 RepID=UPI002ED22F01